MARSTGEWTFEKVRVKQGRGKRMPHLDFRVYQRVGQEKRWVGRVNVHVHHHRGRDKKVDMSVGITVVGERRPIDN